jgi:cyclophilin family peptidyl-prolyl cis-trans isomerase
MWRPIPRFTRGVLFASLLVSSIASSMGQPRKVPVGLIVEMVVNGRGTIRIELLPAVAPKTVLHILELADKRFYDGILFHRVEAKLIAQAGDPESKKIDGAKIADITPSEVTQRYHLGMGGSGKTVPLEAVAPCMRGTLGLGRGLSPDSGDCQFFFNLSDNHRLDNQYTVFGKVIQGLDIMDAIRQGDRIKSFRRVRKNVGKGR